MRTSSASSPSRVVATVVTPIVASLAVIGLVWATSIAEEGTPPDSTEVTDPTDPEDDTDVSVPEDDKSPGDLEDALARIESLEATVADLEEQLGAALVAIDDAVASVASVGSRISKLATDGTYTGGVAPRQISPRLDANDISGKWPLDRTSGELGSDRLNISASGCNSDSRFYSVLSLGSFRGFSCVRIPKTP